MIEDVAKPRQTQKGSENSSWYFEVKYDGTRQFLFQRENVTELFNKRGNKKTRHYPDVTSDVSLPEGTVLDGEMVVKTEVCPHGDKHLLQKRDGGKPVVRKSGKKNFKQKIKMRQYPATFVAFDVLRDSGHDKKGCEIEERRARLEELVEMCGDSVMLAERFDNISTAWDTVKTQDMEGVVAKKPETVYPKGRTSKWKKIKNVKDVVRTVLDYEEHSKGVTAVTGQGDRVTVNGRQAEDVKKAVDRNGSLRCEITCLEETDSGSLREPTWKRCIKE